MSASGHVLLVVKGDQFYQVLYVAARGHESQADMLHFLGSFTDAPDKRAKPSRNQALTATLP